MQGERQRERKMAQLRRKLLQETNRNTESYRID
jgi:hypothetical protein